MRSSPLSHGGTTLGGIKSPYLTYGNGDFYKTQPFSSSYFGGSRFPGTVLEANPGIGAGWVGQRSPSTFQFQPRTEPLNWRLLFALDLERVVRDIDLDALEYHIPNIAYARVDLDELHNSGCHDAMFLKLFHLAQLIMEYLLFMHSHLSDVCAALQQKVRTLQEDNDQLNRKCKSSNKENLILKKDLKQRKKSLSVYEMLARQSEEAGGTRTVVEGGEAAPAKPLAVLVRCSRCGKRFVNSRYLDDHIARRHGEEPTSPLQKQTIQQAVSAVAKEELMNTERLEQQITQITTGWQQMADRLHSIEREIDGHRIAQDTRSSRSPQSGKSKVELGIEAKLQLLQTLVERQMASNAGPLESDTESDSAKVLSPPVSKAEPPPQEIPRTTKAPVLPDVPPPLPRAVAVQSDFTLGDSANMDELPPPRLDSPSQTDDATPRQAARQRLQAAIKTLTKAAQREFLRRTQGGGLVSHRDRPTPEQVKRDVFMQRRVSETASYRYQKPPRCPSPASPLAPPVLREFQPRREHSLPPQPSRQTLWHSRSTQPKIQRSTSVPPSSDTIRKRRDNIQAVLQRSVREMLRRMSSDSLTAVCGRKAPLAEPEEVESAKELPQRVQNPQSPRVHRDEPEVPAAESPSSELSRSPHPSNKWRDLAAPQPHMENVHPAEDAPPNYPSNSPFSTIPDHAMFSTEAEVQINDDDDVEPLTGSWNGTGRDAEKQNEVESIETSAQSPVVDTNVPPPQHCYDDIEVHEL